MIHTNDYCDEVEDIVDVPVFENCKLKVKGIWYKYNGELLLDENELAELHGVQPSRRTKLKILLIRCLRWNLWMENISCERSSRIYSN
jgi:hypothetical protein